MFYDTYAELCRRSGEKPYAVAALCGATSNSSVAQWQKGSTPRKPVLQKIAEHFNVTMDYLLTGEEKQPSVPEGLSEKDQRLIAWFRSLSREKQEALLTLQDGPLDVL